ncbi:MAG: bifunctional adenosylcobinamide kinase/adenosylcobinamide-phosphate guanylyltransferase [Spirochaetales bacterium]|nr:bifunctional adenosylcobinamide kinase/adenosylcobinamide-phosphate guanylyltransferase [Spirochaetales bacterium]
MADLTLVLGGIKTGKTRFAQERAALREAQGGTVVYLATAQAFDEEMEDRIARHKADRPGHWLTVEEPLKIADAYEKQARGAGIVLLDCLTLWLTNFMAADLPPQGEPEKLPDKDRVWEVIVLELDRLCERVKEGDKELVIISNLVENGLVSPYAFARMYQDLAGLTHQFLAARAASVFTMTAGIPICLKGKE